MGYVSGSIWHCSYKGNKITGKVTLLEDLANKKEIVNIELDCLKHLKRSHFFMMYKFILNKKFNFKKSEIDTNFILTQLLERLFNDVDLQYPIYVLEENKIYTVVLDGNRRLDRAFLLKEKTIKAKIFTLNELVDIIEAHDLNI